MKNISQAMLEKNWHTLAIPRKLLDKNMLNRIAGKMQQWFPQRFLRLFINNNNIMLAILMVGDKGENNSYVLCISFIKFKRKYSSLSNTIIVAVLEKQFRKYVIFV